MSGKIIMFISAVLLIITAVVLFSLQPGRDAQIYGSSLEEGDYLEIQLSSILENTGEYTGKNIVLEGSIREVCGTSGCWIIINDGSHQLFIQFYDFTVNLSPGTRVQVWGELRQKQDNPYLAGQGMKVMR